MNRRLPIEAVSNHIPHLDERDICVLLFFDKRLDLFSAQSGTTQLANAEDAGAAKITAAEEYPRTGHAGDTPR